MRKYIAYTVMIITVLLAGCARNDNTQPAPYNISLETLGANETADLNRYIDRNDQVGDMYNLNRITGCKILDAASYHDDDEEGESTVISFMKLTPWNADNMGTVAEYAVDRCYNPYVSKSVPTR